jgi:beta-phosphoglucomutase-like phosphatase (HAD superfamily)
MKFRGAIFDVDGVLVDSPHERAWRESLERLMAVPWKDIAARTSYTPEAFTTALYQTYVAGKPREAGARAVLEHFGVPDPDGSRLREYCEVKQSYLIALIERGEFVAFDDALRFLLALKAAGLKIGAASSSKNANLFLRKVPLARFAERHGAVGGPPPQEQYPFVGPETTLLDLFDANVCGRDFARGKPAPDIFLTAAAELQLPPAECVVVEDAQSGVLAAKAGGMACIGIARLGDEALLATAGADRVVTSLDDLPVVELIG